MARSNDPDSAGSQFFSCLTREKCQHLDGSYTAFGQVVEGMDVLEALGNLPADRNTGLLDDPPTMTSVSPLET